MKLSILTLRGELYADMMRQTVDGCVMYIRQRQHQPHQLVHQRHQFQRQQAHQHQFRRRQQVRQHQFNYGY